MTLPHDADGILIRLGLRERVAQMVFPRCAGTHQVDGAFEVYRLRPWIQEHGIGGVIVFGGNVFETAAAMNALQREAKVPLLISADLEAGTGQQVRGATVLPPAMALGAAADRNLCRLAGTVTALEARAFGIHLVFAPVADLNVEPDNPVINIRAFGDQATAVSECVGHWVAGCLEGGAIPTVKHFPGHGSTTLDSHLRLPRVDIPAATLEAREWAPFRAAFAEGASACMIAHLLVPELDCERPASLSARVIHGVLRERLGFNGLVVSDALTMAGALEGIGPEEACVRAALAGCDVLLHPEDPLAAIEAVTRATESGRIPESTIEAAARRILETKERLGLLQQKMTDVGRIQELVESHAAVPEQIAAASITLVSQGRAPLPIRLAPDALLAVLTVVEEDADRGAAAEFVRALERHHRNIVAVQLRPGMTDAQSDAELARLTVERPLIVGIFSTTRGYKGTARLHPDLVRRLRAWFDSPADDVCLVSFGNPYVLRDLFAPATLLAAWSPTRPAVHAAADALLGSRSPHGRMPVRWER